MDTVMPLSARPDVVAAVAVVLRSLGLKHRNEVLALAARLAANAGGSVEEARRRAITELGDWFAKQMRQPDLDPEQAFLIGRAAFVMLNAAERWPGALLAASPAPDFTDALAAHAPQPCPAVPPTPMVAQSLDTPSLVAPLAWLVRGLHPGGARTA